MTSTNGEQLPRTRYLKHTLRLTLDEMYTGTVRKLAINKNRVCDVCRGIGSLNAHQDYDTCEQCNGLGVQTVIIRTTPYVQEQIHRDCYLCWGKGKAMIPEDRCHTCHGQKVVAEQCILIVKVRRGTRHQQKIIYKGEGTQEPNMRPGDIVVIFEAIDHPIFKRDGDDLIMKMRLDLVESLCGFEKLVKTLDKRQLSVSSPRGRVIQNNDAKYLVGEGMPKFRNPTEKGKLIIEFEINFPDRIRTRHVNSLEECLPPRQQVEIPVDAVERNLVSVPAYKRRYEDQSHPSNNLNDDECAQQYDQHNDTHYNPNDPYDQYDNQYGDEQYNHHNQYYHNDDNSYEVQGNYEHPRDQHYNNVDNHGVEHSNQQGHYYYDDNSYEVQGNYEHPSEHDLHNNHSQGYDSHNNFDQQDDDSLESYDATQQYRFNE